MNYTHGTTALAWVILFGWPIVVFLLFRKLPRVEALIWSVVAGYLLLPFGVEVKIKMIPTFDKDLIPILAAGLMLLVVPAEGLRRLRAAPAPVPHAEGQAPTRSRYARTRSTPDAAEGAVLVPRRIWLIDALLLLLLVTPFFTTLGNPDPVVVGDHVSMINGLTLYDSFSLISGKFVELLPFIIARRYLARPETHKVLLRILAVLALFYTIPVLYEVRMSPQLARMVYGFLSQSFAQAMRDGGFRPVVFLQHGLWLAIFLATAALAALALWREEREHGRRTRWGFAGLYLAAVLALCHSSGALVEFLLLLPVLLFLPIRGQLIIASVVVLIIMGYPALRGANLIPTEQVVSFVKANLNAERAQSLQFRLRNEDVLLNRADEKPLVGWGGWGRSFLYDSYGKRTTVTDGMWIIVIGGLGWLGYIGTFGLLGVPILLLALRQRRMDISFATAGLVLVLTANLMDMIPNATLTPVTWLIAGALAGRCGLQVAARESPEAEGRRRGSAGQPRPVPATVGRARAPLTPRPRVVGGGRG